jgi:hypothetical protein
MPEEDYQSTEGTPENTRWITYPGRDLSKPKRLNEDKKFAASALIQWK